MEAAPTIITSPIEVGYIFGGELLSRIYFVIGMALNRDEDTPRMGRQRSVSFANPRALGGALRSVGRIPTTVGGLF